MQVPGLPGFECEEKDFKLNSGFYRRSVLKNMFSNMSSCQYRQHSGSAGSLKRLIGRT